MTKMACLTKFWGVDSYESEEEYQEIKKKSKGRKLLGKRQTAKNKFFETEADQDDDISDEDGRKLGKTAFEDQFYKEQDLKKKHGQLDLARMENWAREDVEKKQ